MKKLKTPLSACPYCGCEQFYVRATVYGTTSVFYRFDGEPGDNTHMWDYVQTREQKTAFCGECQRKLGVTEFF